VGGPASGSGVVAQEVPEPPLVGPGEGATWSEGWWSRHRPAWTQPGWWDTTLREEVRGLLWLPVGPALVGALAALGTASPCPLPHEAERMASQPTPRLTS
jgi:hypothetical protein